MQRTRFPRTSSLLLATAVALSLTTSGCAISSGGSSGSSQDGQDGSAPTPAAAAPSSGSAPSASASATADSTFAVPGYAVGEIPPVPLFALPNLIAAERLDRCLHPGCDELAHLGPRHHRLSRPLR